jgi:recombination protein RecT
VCFDVYSKEFPAKDGALGWFIGMLAVRSMRAERKSVGKDRTRLPAASNFTSNQPGKCQDISTEDEMTEQNQLAVIKNYVRSDEIVSRFREVLGNREAAAYVSSVMLAVASNNSLTECTPQSIVSAALRSATLRLSVDPSIGQAYLVPFKGKSTLIVGYKGYIHMALRTNKYRDLNVGKVYEGQEVIEDQITGHIKIEGKRISDKVIGYVGYFVLVNGYSKTIYMTVEEIHELAKKHSKSYGYKDSAWTTNTTDMEKKTLLRRLLTHWGVLDPHDANALATIDDSGETNGYQLPGLQDITPPAEEKHTEAENMKALGFDPGPENKKIDATTGEITTTEETPQTEPPATEVIETSAPVNLPGNALSNYFHMAIGIVATDHLEWLLIENSRPKVAKGVEETPETLAAIREVLAVRKA